MSSMIRKVLGYGLTDVRQTTRASTGISRSTSPRATFTDFATTSTRQGQEFSWIAPPILSARSARHTRPEGG
jgi:hypothetical protein